MSNKKKKKASPAAKPQEAVKDAALEAEDIPGQEDEAVSEEEAPAEEQPREIVSKSINDLLGDVVKAQKEGKLEASDEEDEAYNEEESGEEKRSKDKKHTNVRQLKHGMMSTVLTIVFVAAVVLVNVIATVLFERYPLTLDLTKEKKFSISDESIDYVEKIDTEVMITIFSTEEDFTSLSDYTRQAVEVMKKYKQYNDLIDYRFVEIDSNPDIVSEYGIDTVSIYDIIVETNPTNDVKRTRKVTLIDLLSFDDEFLTNLSNYGMTIDTLADQYGDLQVLQYYGGYVTASRADQAFVSALMAVTDPNPTSAVFLTGRKEANSLDYLHTLLEANGYQVKDIDITKEEIPEDTSLVIIAAPCVDYLPEEINKIDEYLENGGAMGKQMLYCASVLQPETPNLDEFLAEYGIEIGSGVVCEQSSDYYYQFPYYTIAVDIADKFLQDVSAGDPVLINAASRPIKLLFDERGFNGTEAYVSSTGNAYVMDMTTGDQVSKGQQVYTAVASKVNFSSDDSADSYSNIVVYGAVETLSDGYLSFSQFNNREYVLSLLNGVTNKTRTGIVIEPVVINGNVYDLTEKQSSVLQWTFILIVPVAVLIIGGVIWLRRKNR